MPATWVPAQPALRFGVSPNKLYDYMAAGRPVLFAADAANQPVQEADCGRTVAPEDPAALAAAIRRWPAASEAERRAGRQRRAYVERATTTAGLARRARRDPAGRRALTGHATNCAGRWASWSACRPTTSHCSGGVASRSTRSCARWASARRRGDRPGLHLRRGAQRVLYAGATPVYVDIDEATYTADPAAVAAAMRPRTRVGAGAEHLRPVGRPRCPHRRRPAARSGGDRRLHAWPRGDLQRPAERRGGARGVLLDAVEQADLHRPGRHRGDDGRRARAELAASSAPHREPRALDRALLGRCPRPRAHRHAAHAASRPRRVPGRSRAGLVPGSSSGKELEGAEMPESFVAAMSAFQARLASRRLATLAVGGSASGARWPAATRPAWPSADARPTNPTRRDTRSCATPARARTRCLRRGGDDRRGVAAESFPLAAVCDQWDRKVGLPPGRASGGRARGVRDVNLPPTWPPDGPQAMRSRSSSRLGRSHRLTGSELAPPGP